MNAHEYVQRILYEGKLIKNVYWVACGGSRIDLYPAHCLINATSTSIESGIYTGAEFNAMPPAS
jgi:fructoselysine-6-P-deglycase FrlB-like protein